MKITNYAILFAVIFICLSLPRSIKTDHIQTMVKKQKEYNQALDASVQDAVFNLVEMDSAQKVQLNKDEAVQRFFKSLYSNFGILQDVYKQEQLKIYVPVILITDEDGYYIYYSHFEEKDGSPVLYQNWTEKKAYSYEDERYVYALTLGNFIRIYDKQSNEVYEGDYHDLAAMMPGSTILASEAVFEECRRTYVVESIVNDMNYYINEHNRIARFYGVTYNFALPSIQQEDWYRTIDDISFMVVFQGYPYGSSRDYYNRYEIGGARIRKTSSYYINMDNGIPVYHRSSCSKIVDRLEPYYTKLECAREGAFPCTECNP